MPPRKVTTAANPDPSARPGSPQLEATISTVDPYPEPKDSDGDVLMPDEARTHDENAAGPSTSTYIPPQDDPARPPSPPLPPLHTRAFPPEEDDDEEDDEVLATLPVYMSPALFPTLNLFQYPLRTETLEPPKYAQARNKFITTRVKENVGRVEVELPVDEDVTYWRRERAEELGFVRDVNEDDSGVVGGYGFGGRGGDKDKDKDKKGKKKDKSHWGEKMRLKSEPIPNETGYYSGVIQDGALFLHPVTRVSQFRTSLGYLDDHDERVRARAARKKGEDVDDKKSKPNGVSQYPLQMRAKKGEEENDGSGSIKQFREKMWTMAKEESEDPWVTYAWKNGEDDEAVNKALGKLIVSPEKRDRLSCKTRPLDYLDNPRNPEDLQRK